MVEQLGPNISFQGAIAPGNKSKNSFSINEMIRKDGLDLSRVYILYISLLSGISEAQSNPQGLQKKGDLVYFDDKICRVRKLNVYPQFNMIEAVLIEEDV